VKLEARPDKFGSSWFIYDAENNVLLAIVPGVVPEAEKLAKLFAAAPALLEGLKAMMTFEHLIRAQRPAAVYTLERSLAAVADAEGGR
jgi:hypothetical protein